MSATRPHSNAMRWITVVSLLLFIALQVYDISSSDGRVRSIIMSLGVTIAVFSMASGALPGSKNDGTGRTGKVFMAAGIAIMALAMFFVDGRLRIAFI